MVWPRSGVLTRTYSVARRVDGALITDGILRPGPIPITEIGSRRSWGSWPTAAPRHGQTDDAHLEPGQLPRGSLRHGSERPPEHQVIFRNITATRDQA
jgi:hypothetical protein